MNPRFIADVHLGKLAKLLRMLGVDTSYNNSYTNSVLIADALQQDRILLTKNPPLLQTAGVHVFAITNETPEIQLRQVLQHFSIRTFSPFSRCIVCNGLFEPVAKEKILAKLEPNTAQHFNEFWQCKNCGRIYWKGSHYERMRKLVEKMSDQDK